MVGGDKGRGKPHFSMHVMAADGAARTGFAALVSHAECGFELL